MALPQQVLERLSREAPKTPGWSTGLLAFSGGILAIMLIIYFGLAFGYTPYLNGSIRTLNQQIASKEATITPEDKVRLTSFYSKIANMKQLLDGHVTFSRFFSWLEKNTVANVSYSRFSFSSGSQISLVGAAASEADVNQQMAIFEASPEVKSATISSVGLSSETGKWNFSVVLVMNAFSPTTTP